MRRLAAPLVLTTLALTGCGSDTGGAPSDDVRTGDPDRTAAAEPAEPTDPAPTIETDEPTRTPAPSPTPTFRPGVAPEVEQVLTDLDVPWGLAPLDDGGLLIGLRDSAEILLAPAGGGEPSPVGSVPDVRAEGESGLLGLALTDDERTLYAYRTGPSENSVVRMSWDGRRLGEPEVVVSGIPGGASFHQGGALVIGPDGLLYLGTGDNGVPEDAQDPNSLSGKVLRYTAEGRPAPDNPSGDAVFSSGHRNVEGLVFDDAGRLWASEFGADRFDELNLVEAGNDYGWPEVEGSGGEPEFTDPAAVWTTDDASPSGIGLYDGSVWLAGLRGATLWEVPVPLDPDAGANAVADPVPHLRGEYGRIRNAVGTADGTALWVVTSNTDGRGEPEADDDLLLRLTR